jgi:ATP-dependent Clp protease, protease subunit
MSTPSSDKESWFIFAGVIDTGIARAFAHHMANALAEGLTRVHILIQSPGGSVSDGVFICNLLSALPMEVVAYNSGHIGSAAATAYLGAGKRLVSESGTFLLHRTIAGSGASGNAAVLGALADSVRIDDARTETIFRTRATLSEEQWAAARVTDLVLDAPTAIAAGIAHAMGSFSPRGRTFAL